MDLIGERLGLGIAVAGEPMAASVAASEQGSATLRFMEQRGSRRGRGRVLLAWVCSGWLL